METATPSRVASDQAITSGLEANWADALEQNTKIIEASPNDAAAHNRMGRAYLEMGKLENAKEAYVKTLELEPNNTIAARNVARLTTLIESKTKTNMTKSKAQPRLFIEDMGKTAILKLLNVPSAQVVAKYSPGAEVELKDHNGLLAVYARDGGCIGCLEPKIGRRLADLIATGNTYVAAIVSNDPENPRITVREVLQSPENAYRISFPGHYRPTETKERTLLKTSFLRDGEEAVEEDEIEEAIPVDGLLEDDTVLAEESLRIIPDEVETDEDDE